MTTQMDPQILLHPECEHSSVSTADEYVDRIVDWLESDRDFAIGHYGREFLVEEFAIFGYPQNRVELSLAIDSSLVIKQIGRLISRSYREENPPPVEIVGPSPKGDEIVRSMLEGELSLAASGEERVFATDPSHWGGEPGTVSLADGRLVECVTTSNSIAQSEIAKAAVRYFESKTLIIVGGSEDREFLSYIDDIGIRAKHVRWLEVEKDQSAKILRRQLKGIRRGDYVVACWTGKIGHDGSGIVKKECASRGVCLVRGESLADLAEGLRAIPGSQS